MLELRSIVYSYDQINVLNKLSLSLPSAKIHGLIGLNGAGKTTLLNCIYGFLTPESGTITWNEKALDRRDVAFLETTNFFYSDITGREYLSIFPDKSGVFDLNAWQALLQLPLDELIEEYSTGMKKKLALLAILKLDRQVIILDEPANGLDLESNHLLEKIMRILCDRGKTIILTSHIISSLLTICDEVHWLKAGKIEQTFMREAFDTINATVFQHVVGDEHLEALL
jgi:ABC-2 type transport system ATP-binding protein